MCDGGNALDEDLGLYALGGDQRDPADFPPGMGIDPLKAIDTGDGAIRQPGLGAVAVPGHGGVAIMPVEHIGKGGILPPVPMVDISRIGNGDQHLAAVFVCDAVSANLFQGGPGKPLLGAGGGVMEDQTVRLMGCGKVRSRTGARSEGVDTRNDGAHGTGLRGGTGDPSQIFPQGGDPVPDQLVIGIAVMGAVVGGPEHLSSHQKIVKLSFSCQVLFAGTDPGGDLPAPDTCFADAAFIPGEMAGIQIAVDHPVAVGE